MVRLHASPALLRRSSGRRRGESSADTDRSPGRSTSAASARPSACARAGDGPLAALRRLGRAGGMNSTESGRISRPSTQNTTRSANGPGIDSSRSFSQLGSLATSATNEPSRAKVIETCVCSRSCADTDGAQRRTAPTTYNAEPAEHAERRFLSACSASSALIVVAHGGIIRPHDDPGSCSSLWRCRKGQGRPGARRRSRSSASPAA